MTNALRLMPLSSTPATHAQVRSGLTKQISPSSHVSGHHVFHRQVVLGHAPLHVCVRARVFGLLQELCEKGAQDGRKRLGVC